MEKVKRPSQLAGISIVSFIIVIGVSLSYYQFIFLPQMNAKPTVPENVLHPPKTTQITISPGSSQQSQTKNFEPKAARGAIGTSNKVVWTNHDVTAHSVTSDAHYVDAINGPFNSLDSIGLIPPKGTYQFTFTKTGDYPYHCEPHPWMTGKVSIVESFG